MHSSTCEHALQAAVCNADGPGLHRFSNRPIAWSSAAVPADGADFASAQDVRLCSKLFNRIMQMHKC